MMPTTERCRSLTATGRPAPSRDRVQAAVATAFVVEPFAGLGVTVGFHRLLTHHTFTAAPALRVPLAVAGSMSFDHLA
jgi:fatty-acid desaturase